MQAQAQVKGEKDKIVIDTETAYVAERMHYVATLNQFKFPPFGRFRNKKKLSKIHQPTDLERDTISWRLGD